MYMSVSQKFCSEIYILETYNCAFIHLMLLKLIYLNNIRKGLWKPLHTTAYFVSFLPPCLKSFINRLYGIVSGLGPVVKHILKSKSVFIITFNLWLGQDKYQRCFTNKCSNKIHVQFKQEIATSLVSKHMNSIFSTTHPFPFFTLEEIAF